MPRPATRLSRSGFSLRRTRGAGTKLRAMLDHVGINVSDYDRSREFYERALAPLGFSLLMEPIPRTGGFGSDGKPWFWIDQRELPRPRTCMLPSRPPTGRRWMTSMPRRSRPPGPTTAPWGTRALPPDLLRRLCPRPRRQQRRGGLPPPRRIHTAPGQVLRGSPSSYSRGSAWSPPTPPGLYPPTRPRAHLKRLGVRVHLVEVGQEAVDREVDVREEVDLVDHDQGAGAKHQGVLEACRRPR